MADLQSLRFSPWLAALLVVAGRCAAAEPDEVRISSGERDAQGILTHTIESPYQSGRTALQVLLPDKLPKDQRYPVLYVLPVEAGSGKTWGDGLREVRKHDL